MSEFVISVVAWTIGAVISTGRTPARWRSCVTPARTPSSGAAGVVSVLSTTTTPESPSMRTTSVNVPPMSTASLQSVTRRSLHSFVGRQVSLAVGRRRRGSSTRCIRRRRRTPNRRAIRREGRGTRRPDRSTVRSVVSTSPMRKSSLPRTMMPSCSFSVWWWRKDPVAPPAMRQKHSWRSVPVITRRRKPSRSVSTNLSSSRKKQYWSESLIIATVRRARWARRRSDAARHPDRGGG